jgi:hypothetical protein
VFIEIDAMNTAPKAGLRESAIAAAAFSYKR